MRRLVERLVAAPAGRRGEPVAALYRRFARFVADDLIHMDHEEHDLLRDLQAVFTDAELQEMEGCIVASIPPAEMVLFMDAILGALPPADRDGLLAAMRAAMPQDAYSELMAGIERRRASRQILQNGA
ncbi:hypothetical protein FGK63_16265 [Ruegeria sediminis]|uniref:Hemerythrin-like domain-containing protein n=1 Tax=Ruegeria sediminis TaxID=2583820 RepID=A0ABY2WV75_9RHOB|nr:hypothetical protein FGK63_16265 [Ruegeria sediminis]